MPDGSRWGKPSGLFWMWAGAVWNVEFLIYGCLAVIVFGLSFAQAVVIIIIGNAFYLLTGLASLQGPKAGTTTFAISRAPFGPNGNRIRVKSAIYNSATDSVTLSLGQQLVLRKTYRLTVNGTAPSGLTNPEGLLLDGAGTGVPGSNFVTTITQNNLAGSANQRPRPTAAIVKTRAKADVIRAKLAQHKHAK